jgi:hypothetical protein
LQPDLTTAGLYALCSPGVIDFLAPTAACGWQRLQMPGRLPGSKSGEMVRPERFELPTCCSGGNRSIQLSYGRADAYSLHGQGRGINGNIAAKSDEKRKAECSRATRIGKMLQLRKMNRAS